MFMEGNGKIENLHLEKINDSDVECSGYGSGFYFGFRSSKGGGFGLGDGNDYGFGNDQGFGYGFGFGDCYGEGDRAGSGCGNDLGGHTCGFGDGSDYGFYYGFNCANKDYYQN